MVKIWYKEQYPGILLKGKGEILLVSLFCDGIWLQKYINRKDLTNRTNSISPYIFIERKKYFDRRNKLI